MIKKYLPSEINKKNPFFKGLFFCLTFLGFFLFHTHSFGQSVDPIIPVLKDTLYNTNQNNSMLKSEADKKYLENNLNLKITILPDEAMDENKLQMINENKDINRTEEIIIPERKE